MSSCIKPHFTNVTSVTYNQVGLQLFSFTISTGLATVVLFFLFFIGATMSAKLALSVPFACCWLSCFYEVVFMNKYKMPSYRRETALQGAL